MSALALVVLLASAPLAEDPDYTSAIALFEDVEFEQALFRFQSAAVRPGLNQAERAELFLWIGLCYANIGDLESAERQFRDGLNLFPDAPLPQPNTSPIIIELFERVKTEVKAAAASPTAETPTTDGDVEGRSTDDPPQEEEATVPPGEGSDGLPWILISGGGVAAGGAALLLIAAATAGGSYIVFAQGQALTSDLSVFGSDIKSLELMANVILGSAVGIAALGLVVVVAGGATAGASFALE